MRRLSTPALTAGLLAGITGLVAAAAVPAAAANAPGKPRDGAFPGGYKNLVVIYEENHSFDNLYGMWGTVKGNQSVNGLQNATAAKTTQVAQDGSAYACLLQNDVNLTSPPLSASCQTSPPASYASAFHNTWFTIDDYIKPDDKTCPAPGVFATFGVLKDSPGALSGGCTRDIVHRFYQEQFQIDGGKQDRYVTGSDAVGLVMGRYDTKALPIYQYLHSDSAPNYVIADNFFQGAFGGSFLNHQWLIAAQAPVDTNGSTTDAALHSIVDTNGFPNAGYPLYKPATTVKDTVLTQACGPTANPKVACGDYGVNTMQPSSPPFGSGPKLPLIDDTKYPNIGDRMTAAGVSWNWYSGGWDDAAAGHPGPLFQYHHQPFNYFANYAPGTPGRAHLQDETKFTKAAKNGTLPQVSFLKPYGDENEHPGYSSERDGSKSLVATLKDIMSGPQARDTLVVVTYDEFGGQWDHVSPPTVDKFGPGTRIPALVLSAGMIKSGVDSTQYDTTSIMATIEHAYGLAPVASRDAVVNDLTAAIRTGDPRHQGQDGR